ncbi:unnamed protein product [Ambrosiozyma monospora]|uniref:Unnamed protein product n=1 Tax=Ambrosiozyma monospora TaxID=43982 RepID=A0ACB5T8W6_AMBMO|nr:unnamed protein product [Ambrosiozyma monospora]
MDEVALNIKSLEFTVRTDSFDCHILAPFINLKKLKIVFNGFYDPPRLTRKLNNLAISSIQTLELAGVEDYPRPFIKSDLSSLSSLTTLIFSFCRISSKSFESIPDSVSFLNWNRSLIEFPGAGKVFKTPKELKSMDLSLSHPPENFKQGWFPVVEDMDDSNLEHVSIEIHNITTLFDPSSLLQKIPKAIYSLGMIYSNELAPYLGKPLTLNFSHFERLKHLILRYCVTTTGAYDHLPLQSYQPLDLQYQPESLETLELEISPWSSLKSLPTENLHELVLTNRGYNSTRASDVFPAVSKLLSNVIHLERVVFEWSDDVLDLRWFDFAEAFGDRNVYMVIKCKHHPHCGNFHDDLHIDSYHPIFVIMNELPLNSVRYIEYQTGEIAHNPEFILIADCKKDSEWLQRNSLVKQAKDVFQLHDDDETVEEFLNSYWDSINYSLKSKFSLERRARKRTIEQAVVSF